MASLRDIRNRIRSVKSNQQITKAMKMVSAAKLRRAQDAVESARPYAKSIEQIVSGLLESGVSASHPLLTSREIKNVELIVITSDRGLAGGFNANVIRRASRFLVDNAHTYASIRLATLGRKGNEYFKRRDVPIRQDYAGIFSRVNYASAASIAREVSADFLAEKVDAVFLVYNEFVSAIAQNVKLTQLLPMMAAESPTTLSAVSNDTAPKLTTEFEYEPGPEALLNRLIPQALAIKIYRAILESVASEHGARMSAMENATSNATEMIDKLSLFYNRTRQAVITKELMEIVSGAEALK